MNFEQFIASRTSKASSTGFTHIIIRIAVATVALSLTVMIVTSAVVTGFKNQITDKVFGFWGHIHVTDNIISRSFEQVPFSIDQKFYDDLKGIEYVEFDKQASIMGMPLSGKYERTRTKGGVAYVQSYADAPGIINLGDTWEAINIKGVHSDYNWDEMGRFIVEGKPLNTKSEKVQNEILVSRTTATRLRLKLDQQLIVHFIHEGAQIKRRFKVVGIYNTGLAEYDKRIAIVDIRKLRQFMNWSPDQVGGIEVFVENLDDLPVLTEYIYEELLPSNLYAQTIKEKYPNIFEWLELTNINEYVILCLMVIVCIINMITVLLILILDRTKMIGILKSLGSDNWSIRKIFLYQSFYIVSRGLVIGTALGVGICLLQQYFGFIKLDEVNYYLAEAPIELNIWTILLLNLLTAVIVVLFTVIPTYLVTKIEPTKVLRFD